MAQLRNLTPKAPGLPGAGVLNKMGHTTVKDTACILCDNRMQDSQRTDIRVIQMKTCRQPRKVHTKCWKEYEANGSLPLDKD